MAMLVRSVTLHFLSSNSGIRDRESFKWIFSENVQSVTYIAPEKWCLTQPSWTLKKKFERLMFPTKYVIPKSLHKV